MAEPNLKKRIWGWFFFDWASQPYHTLLVTFIFGPYFVSVASGVYMGDGLDELAADARAQSYWALGLTLSGLIVGFGGPFVGAFADAAGRRLPWIALFSALYVVGATALWWVLPDGSNLAFGLFAFGLGFVGAEFALILTNAQLPSLGDRREVGRISGSGFAFGYLGGLVALILALLLLVEQSNGKTIAGLAPLVGDPEAREGTRAVGPFVALWFLLFMIPYFLWVRDVASPATKPKIRDTLGNLARRVRGLTGRRSLASFLGGSMLYRDALNGLYGFGGTYAYLVLNWEITQVGVFGIVILVSAVFMSWIGGRIDRRIGPKPVIVSAVLVLILVCSVILNMTDASLFGMALPEGSTLPDRVFMICGVLIGGVGGVLQSASRSLMVRHSTPQTVTEDFGLYGLAGRATSFLGHALIGMTTVLTGNARFGVLPLIVLFILGLVLLRWTHAEGDQAAP